MSDKPKVIVIVGPTGVGKTALSIEAAKQLNGEVISGDSMQIYKGLDIGTAKITKEEMEGIPHHLLDTCTVEDSFTAADFQHLGRKAILTILDKQKVPIIAGGTGLYIEALLYELSLGRPSSSNEKIRFELEKKAEKNGKEALWKELKEIDPSAAKGIHPNNLRRVVRALEVFLVTGELFSSQKQEIKKSPYDFLVVGLKTDRRDLYERIDTRVERMMADGLEEEAKYVWETASMDHQAMKGIGYKEFIPYFEGKESIEEVISAIQKNSRNYAKRQLTWFRNRMDEIKWFDLVQHPTQLGDAIEYMDTFLKKEP